MLQQTARMYAKVRELNEAFNTFSTNVTNEINQFEQDTNDEIERFEQATNDEIERFEGVINDTVEEYIEKFNDLHDYVEDYFDNLDVQEEINNKLDEMVEDGTFDTLLANYLVICGGNAKQLGCAGDGVTDDTTAINTAISQLSTLGVNKLVFPSGEFVISGAITVPSDFILEGMEGSVLKYVGNGTEGNIIEIQGTDADNYKENIIIRNINIDGTNQVYKGGHSMDTPAETDTDPLYKGLMCINARYVKNIIIENCRFNEVYGDGIVIYYANDVKINNNTLTNVSSGNIQIGGQTGYDNHGDGIVTFFSFNVSIFGNTVINKRVYQSGMAGAIGKPCGRSGLEFEYAINQNASDAEPDDPEFNAPDYSEIPTQTVDGHPKRYGIGLRMDNNYVYGYTKGIHLESRIKTIITNNTILHNHIGIMASVDAYNIFLNNYFNTYGVGAAPQSGYDAYYGGLAISEYSDSTRRYGFNVCNNTFEGEGKGITVASSYINITNNRFFCQKGIFTQASDLEGLNISNNTFNSKLNPATFDNFVYLYHVKSARLISNNFYSETINQNTISGDNITIMANEFVNTAIKHDYGTTNLTIRDNIVKGSTYNINVWEINHADDSVVDNNTFKITGFNTASKVIIKFGGSSTNTTFSNNKFDITTTRNDLIIAQFEVVNRCKFINNYYMNNIDVSLIRVYVSRCCNFENNRTANVLSTVVKATGNFEGWNKYEGNAGALTATGFKPNDSINRMTNQFFDLSQKAYKYNIDSGSTKLGLVCTKAGYYTTTTWSSGNTYTVNAILKNSNSKAYKCITAGSGASTNEPVHTTFADVTEADGYKWQYLGDVATFSEMTL